MNSLFGMELPTPVNFVIAFVVVLLLIGAATWLVRRVGAGRTDAAARGRLPRLAVVDAAAVDGRRKLVIIRRDNVEHLLMIGGPSDVVVETNIVRASAAPAREIPPARGGTADTAPRAIPLPDPTPWPLQPEPVPGPLPSLRAARNAADEAWRTPGEGAAPEVRPVRPVDTLAGLAEELARPIAEPAAPRAPAPQPPPMRPAAAPQQPAPVATTSVPLPSPGAEQSLAEMAQRLEAALRRPSAQKIVAEGQRVTATVEVKSVNQQQKPAQPPAPAAATRPNAPAKPGNLEQEMASLLGKPGKT
jgi:flagellar biogenesis protein FliO